MTRFHHNITIPEVYNHKVEEDKIIRLWNKQKIFENLKKSRREQNDGKFLFHSAPVSPDGHPHSGHILNALIKDVLKRFGYQKNLRVESTFRWNGHSRSIQNEVDKILGITHSGDLKKVNMKDYNDQCEAVADAHIQEWTPVFERLGCCSDLKKAYSTSDNEYMEGVWKVFKQLYDKGLVYRDTKTLPYSTGCSTHLSKFEAEQNIREVSEIGATVALNIVGSNEKLVIWTTNPWTLAFGSSLCVDPNSLYVKVKVKNQIYILAKDRLEFVFNKPSEYNVLEEMSGECLADLTCEPLFKDIPLNAEYKIHAESKQPNKTLGTGITPSEDFPEITLKGGHILNIKEVKNKKPHCLWSDTPLISKKVDTWFVRVKDISAELKKNISLVNWIPNEKLSEEDMINWLDDNSEDWPISRSLNGGTPLPIWSSESGDEIVCVGSLEELKTLSGIKNISNLRREIVDWIRIPSKTPGNPPLRRVPDVFDNYFETSVEPFFWRPADQAEFVVEDFDQTREWCYTTLVIATALSVPLPFRNIVTHGLICEPDGSKVRRQKHNRHDPMRLCEKYGADALRLYLISCSDSNFVLKEEGVAKMADEVVQPLYGIFQKCTTHMGCPRWINYGYITDFSYEERDPIDRWIYSCAESLRKFYIDEMNAYRLNTCLPRVVELIKKIENWYIPLRYPQNLDTTKKETERNSLSLHRSICVLFNVIYRISLVLAPVAPFITETIFQVHRNWMVYYRRPDSLHAAPLFEPCEKIIKPQLDQSIQQMQNVIKIVRNLRAQHMIPIQYPIKEVIIIHHREEFRQGIDDLKDSFKKLINAQVINVSDDYREFGASLHVDLKQSSSSELKQRIFQNLTDDKLQFLIKGYDVEENMQFKDINVSYQAPERIDSNHAIVCSEDFMVVLKMNKVLFFYEEGAVKGLVQQICRLKKQHNYYGSDCIDLYYSTDDECLKNVISKHCDQIKKKANCNFRIKEGESGSEAGKCFKQQIFVKGVTIEMYFDPKDE